MAKLEPYQFGELPVEVINATLDLELDAGEVTMPVNAQIHAQRKRPADYARCFPHVASVIADPLYIGDDFRNEGKIELVGRPPALGTPLLVAVELTLDADGRYSVTSFYPISEQKVQNRREKNHLLMAKPKNRPPGEPRGQHCEALAGVPTSRITSPLSGLLYHPNRSPSGV